MNNIYTIGTKKGYDLVQGMKPGSSVTATDGSVWTMQNDGTIRVDKGGGVLTGMVTYQPTAAEQRQDAISQMPGGTGFKSPYADQLSQVIAGLKDRKWDGWDESDPAYQALRQQHLREADRTAEDVLGRYAQNTGGIAGSGAITAASQAADYQKSKLNDAIPGLVNDDYMRYMQDVAREQQLAGLLMNANQQAESMYYNRVNAALNKWAKLGYADEEVASVLGVKPGTATSDQAYTDWKTAFEGEKYADAQAMAAAKLAGKGSGGGPRGGLGGDEPPGRRQDGEEPAAGEEESYGPGLPPREWHDWYFTLTGLMDAGKTDQAFAFLEQGKDKLSEGQVNRVIDVLDSWGK